MGDNIGGLARPHRRAHHGASGAGLGVCVGHSERLVSGSGIDFQDQGVHELKGVPGEWKLFLAK
jgi:hypothetical protein